jgi:hypothetical protein
MLAPASAVGVLVTMMAPIETVAPYLRSFQTSIQLQRFDLQL